MRYWWVNQNQTYRAEVRGSFMWSPKQNANGARNQFYENMREVSPGDVVFSFCDTRIKAIGVVTGGAQTGPKPDFGAAGSNWSREGWFVPVDYCVLNNQIRPKDHAAILRPFLPSKYSPLQESGDGLQSVYLAELPQALADALIGLIGQAYWDAYATIAVLQSAPEPADIEATIVDAQHHRTDVQGAACQSPAWPGRVQGQRSAAGRILSRHERERAETPEGESHQAVARRD